MIARRFVPVLCACSWVGSLPTSAACPACGRSASNRVSPARLAILRALRSNPKHPIEPAMRIWLLERQLIASAGPAPRPRPERPHARYERQPHALTLAGESVVAAAAAELAAMEGATA